jgi:phosphopantetheinyl transferase (holo-ACP synthase)
MIGNDVIDLRLACRESNWQRKGYLDKIFTVAEQDMIWQAAIPADMVWLLWSCKEAVYKIVNRITNVRSYNPVRFRCTALEQQGEPITGKMLHEAKEYSIVSYRNNSCIHTVAVAHNIFLDKLDIYTGSELPSHLFADGSLLKNQDGIPYLMNCCTNSTVPVSISHHGDYFGVVKRKASC